MRHLLLLALLLPFPLPGQENPLPSQEDLEHVLPEATWFGDREGEPPVIRGYRTELSTGREILVGLAFLTSDVPPEVKGYDAPIEVLVGMDPRGTLTGIRVTRYWESLYQSRGHFLGRRGFQEQFTGKRITDPFRIRRDLDGISGATITVDAMARGIRDASRRVALAHLGVRESGVGASTDGGVPGAEGLADGSWFDLLRRGGIRRLPVVQDGLTRMELFLAPIREDDAGELLLGSAAYREALEELGDTEEGRARFFLGLDGSPVWFRTSYLSLVQGGDTLSTASGDVILFEPPRGGRAAEELRSAGVWLLGEGVDPSRAVTVIYGGGMGLGVFSVQIPAWVPVRVAREEGPGEAEATDPGPPQPPDDPEPETLVAAGDPSTEEPGLPPHDESGPAPDTPEERLDEELSTLLADLQARSDGGDLTEESAFARTLSLTSWPRVGGLALLLLLASAAFATRSTPLRWITLMGALVFLGFVDGSFLSISHLTSAVSVGPGVLLASVPLLLLVVFTLVTTLLWGRVFCGYLCPFGALQDLVEALAPRRLRIRPPPGLHRILWKGKYLLLALLLLQVLAGLSLIPFSYLEPFGTIFFVSSSPLLWGIALGFLGSAILIPRFYCRYACPLGAALALGSALSPFRIRRVEQCDVCVLCTQTCPTGAIRGSEVDFTECVRCSRCEVKLREEAGSCRHSMDAIRPRLVQIQLGESP